MIEEPAAHPSLRAEPPQWDVFISYSRADSSAPAALLARAFAAEGLRVFKDDLSIDPGDRWLERIDDALAGCRCWTSIATWSPSVTVFHYHALAALQALDHASEERGDALLGEVADDRQLPGLAAEPILHIVGQRLDGSGDVVGAVSLDKGARNLGCCEPRTPGAKRLRAWDVSAGGVRGACVCVARGIPSKCPLSVAHRALPWCITHRCRRCSRAS